MHVVDIGVRTRRATYLVVSRRDEAMVERHRVIALPFQLPQAPAGFVVAHPIHVE